MMETRFIRVINIIKAITMSMWDIKKFQCLTQKPPNLVPARPGRRNSRFPSVFEMTYGSFGLGEE